jgi:hypothetical protein
MTDNLDEKKMSADGYSSIEDPVGEKTKAKSTDSAAPAEKMDTVVDGVTKKTNKPEAVVEVAEEAESFDISDIFEGLDLSEDFKSKATLVFEAAVNEAATEKASVMIEETEATLNAQFETSLSESLDDIVENLDGYLDYVVKEWMTENNVAIETGIKVEMAESLMEGLKDLFNVHNIEMDEDTIDVVAGLEEELAAIKETANTAINDKIALNEEIQSLRAGTVFETMTEGLSTAQAERFRVLSEKLDSSDLESYTENLKTLKESFFKDKTETVVSESLDKEGDTLIVEEAPAPSGSQYESVNAYADALKNLK